jgi:anti-sigma regulatory factor (Ser/Thr protein kinase)
MSVTDHDMAVVASSYVNEFCKMKGLENRVSMLVSLCVEEIALNTIEHGFTKDDHPHNADIRLVVDDTKCIIRIRDNCIGFDPTKYIELHQDSDPSSHIGIRIVMGMANEVHYINSLGLNNLYISILK